VKRRLDVVGGQVRVVPENLLVSPAFGQQFHQELDGDPGPFDHGLSHEHLRVNRDAISPVQGCLQWD
jgi:hypothetical protein